MGQKIDYARCSMCARMQGIYMKQAMYHSIDYQLNLKLVIEGEMISIRHESGFSPNLFFFFPN